MEKQEKKRLTANQTRALKLVLDAVMLILLVLMYRKQVISLQFHEIGGLALIGLFLIHNLINGRWITATTRKLFAKGTPGMVRARYIVDALLLVAFLAVGITGVLINKTLFTLHVGGNAKTLHYFASAVAIILMGVHLGLHADYIFGKLFKKGANKIAKIATAALLAAMVAFGGYSLVTTQFVSFLAAPLQAGQLSHGTFQPSGDLALDGSSGERPSDLSELPEFAEGEDAPQPPQSDGTQPSEDGTSATDGSGQVNGQGSGQGGREALGGGHDEGGSTSAALLIAQYVSIITLFGAATYGVVKLTGKRKNSKCKEAINVIEPVEDSPSDEAQQ